LLTLQEHWQMNPGSTCSGNSFIEESSIVAVADLMCKHASLTY
jgi:hypothetical protein